MRKLFYTVVFFVFSSPLLSQEQHVSARVDNLKTFEVNKKANKYVFYFPETANVERVKETAEYYADYFTVNYDEQKKIATILMKNSDHLSKKVISRFLLSNEISEVEAEGKKYLTSEFIMQFVLNQDIKKMTAEE